MPLISYINMIKAGRKPSSDPVQEKLRQNKALWNKDVSTFINDLINLKKTMNGAPSKFFNEKSSIKEPIPADPSTILGVLAGDFQELAQRGNSIISEQINYSKTRKKSQPKLLVPTAPTPSSNEGAGNDLSKQLAAWEHKYELVSEASNPISRFFTRLFNPTIGFGSSADLRRARMAMLNACADTYKNLGKFQVQVVKSSKASVMESNKKLHEAWGSWTLVSRAYAIYKRSKSVNALDKGGDIEQQITMQDLQEEKALESLDKSVYDFEENSKKEFAISPTEEAMDKITEENQPDNIDPDLSSLQRLENIKNMALDYRKNQEFLPPNGGGGYLFELDAAVDKFIASRGKKIVSDFEIFYTKSIDFLNKEFGTTGASFKEIINQLKIMANNKIKPVIPNVVPEKLISNQIDKTAQDFLKKWVGKTMHQLSLFDKTSAYRLNSYKMAAEIRKEIDQIMNLLEKGLDEDKLDPFIKQVNNKIVSLRGMMRSLHLSTPQPKSLKLGN